MAEVADPVVIDPNGDLILDVRQNEAPGYQYRVDSATVRQNSRYFDNLFSPRFSEGQKLSATLDSLKERGYSSSADIPPNALPRISIVDIGRIHTQSTIQNLAADFLRVLHGQPLPTSPPVSNLANLAVVADRFDALPYFIKYMQRKKYLQAVDAKAKGKPSTALPEERVRQKLLVGLFFDYPPWVSRYSKQLIIRDSVYWKPGKEISENAALWWDLPGVEDELIQRREYILETINSLQLHFVKLYSSREKQCKLGYDNSTQCDSFQLGEMIRFFLRLGTIRLQGTIYDSEEPALYSGDMNQLLESLRQVSSYQIDRNHAHCGLRVRIIPLLELIQGQLNLDTTNTDIGLCLECWTQHRKAYAWSLAKRPVLWTPSSSLTGRQNLALGFKNNRYGGEPSSCLDRHLAVRDMFMAVERDWTAREMRASVGVSEAALKPLRQ